jgi:hypothetical protein
MTRAKAPRSGQRRPLELNVTMPTIGIAAGDDGKDGEQQNMLQLVELTLGPARVGDVAEQAEQLIERSHGNLLRIWLPCIDSKKSSRRNRQSASRARLAGCVAPKTRPVRWLYRALNSPEVAPAATTATAAPVMAAEAITANTTSVGTDVDAVKFRNIVAGTWAVE